MAVLVKISNPGINVETYDRVSSNLTAEMKKRAGFQVHYMYPQGESFVVHEIWDTHEQQEDWFDSVRANLPADAQPKIEVVELHNVIVR